MNFQHSIRSVLRILPVLALLQACAQIGVHLSPEFSAHAPKKVAVLAPESNVGDGAGGEELAEQSALMLEAAGYEVVRALEVKAALGDAKPEGDPAALAERLGVDALLRITVLRWDYRARIYASDYTVAARFRLVAADGTELWRVDEHSESLSRETRQGHPQESFRAGGDDEFERLAARLAARVFDTLPPRAGLPDNQ